MSDERLQRGTPEHTERMFKDGNYPSRYEREMLCLAQPEPYMVKQVENLFAMLDYARQRDKEWPIRARMVTDEEWADTP